MMQLNATSGRVRIPTIWFDAYLRTGATPWERSDALELKHNPWHDPRNGQFTFQGQGVRSAGGLGGGGSFGGGGASGSWEVSPAASTRRSAKSVRSAPALSVARAQAMAAARQAIDSQERVVTRNGYDFHLDPAGRTKLVTGTLRLNPGPRSRSAQTAAGGSDRLPSDDGGHYIAQRFDGPSDHFNHFAQNAHFNRGGYRVLEDRWAKATKAGKRVFVRIGATYDKSSKRPASIMVTFTIDGQTGGELFTNGKGRNHGG